MGMKPFNELSPHEKMEMTLMTLQLKEERRLKGIKDADESTFSRVYRCKKRKNRIRLRKYKG